MKTIRRIFAFAAALCIMECATGCLAGRYMVNYALKPEEHGQKLDEDRAYVMEHDPGAVEWYDSLHSRGIIKDTTIIGEGGYKLHAIYAAAPDPEHALATIISCHGYTDNHIKFLGLTKVFRDSLNCNVLIPDHHYHGLSEGRAIQMGWLDRLDIERWIPVAHQIFNSDKIVVHGISMGGAITMMVSGDETPDYVKGFIEDCGYTSVWNQFSKQAKEMHLPVWPILTSANIVCKHKYGWDFKEASSVNQVAKSTKPMLFIHGGADDYVPTSDVYVCYNAKTQGYKDIWVPAGVPHAQSYHDCPAEYQAKVKEFLEMLK